MIQNRISSIPWPRWQLDWPAYIMIKNKMENDPIFQCISDKI